MTAMPILDRGRSETAESLAARLRRWLGAASAEDRARLAAQLELALAGVGSAPRAVTEPDPKPVVPAGLLPYLPLLFPETEALPTEG